MGTEDESIEEEEDEFDPNDPFGINKPQKPRAGRKMTLGQMARENAVVRRKSGTTADGREAVDPFVVGFGKLDDDRVDEERTGFRPGSFYRPFN
jgi:hypothetical protein